MPTLAVRPALPQDEIFLYDLYSAVRAPEFAHAPVPAVQKEFLIRMQFRTQMAAYGEQFPNSCCHIVLLDSQPMGRLLVTQREGDFYLVDIALLPAFQGQGIGSVLVQRIQQQAAAAHLPVRSSVFRFNPGSLRWHQRNGFRIAREEVMQYHLEWQPSVK